jgi:dihydrofolate reductase
MRKIISSTFVTLDNFMVGDNEDISWVTNNFDSEMGGDYMRDMGAILLGKTTYEIMAAAWPNWKESEQPGADLMNNTPKIVISKTLKKAPWGAYNNVTILKEIVPEEMNKLKDQSGKNIVLMGSASIFQQLSDLGLIDEYRLFVHPIVLGSGKPLFKNITHRVNLKLVRTKMYNNGAVLLNYERTNALG